MEVLLPIVILLVGPVAASYMAAYVMRDNKLTQAREARSQCDGCGRTLKWYELVPLFSYPLLRGKCATCGHKIDPRIWLAELWGLVIFLVLAIGVNKMLATASGQEVIIYTAVGTFFCLVLLYLSVYDLFTFSIPTEMTRWAVGAAILANVLFAGLRAFNAAPLAAVHIGYPDNLLMALIAGGFFWAIIRLTRQKGMGIGDVILAVIIASLLGWPATVSAFYTMLISAAVAGLLWAIFKGKLRGTIIPLVPFMTLGFVVAYVWGIEIFNLLFQWPGTNLF